MHQNENVRLLLDVVLHDVTFVLTVHYQRQGKPRENHCVGVQSQHSDRLTFIKQRIATDVVQFPQIL